MKSAIPIYRKGIVCKEQKLPGWRSGSDIQRDSGMACPVCGSRKNIVLDSRTPEDGSTIRRRRACEFGHRWTTREAIVREQIAWSDWTI